MERPDFQVPAPNTYRRARLGSVTMRPGQVRGMQVPSTYHLLFIHSGETFLRRGDGPATHVPAGSAILLRPQDLSHWRTIGPAPSRQTWVALVPDALPAEQLALLDAAPDVQPLSTGLDAVQELIFAIAWQLQAPAESWPSRCSPRSSPVR